MKILYVYLDQELPKYALGSLLNFKRRFPEEDLIYLGDLESNLKLVSSFGIRSFQIEKPIKVWEELANYEVVDPQFRNGFWLHTLARFHAIAQYLLLHPDESILQVECDVLLMDEFPFTLINKTKKEISFPLINESEAVPSVLYIQNAKAGTNLLNYINKQIKIEPYLNDMVLLRNYSKNFPNRVEILPSNAWVDFGFQKWVDLNLKVEISSGAVNYKGIFDGATWGQYISGEDPRNALGFRRVYHVLRNHAVNPSKFVWSYKKNSTSISISANGQTIPLYCLHIHSKDLRLFNTNSVPTIKKRIDDLPRGEKYEFLPWIALTNFRFSIFKILITKYLKRTKKLF